MKLNLEIEAKLLDELLQEVWPTASIPLQFFAENGPNRHDCQKPDTLDSITNLRHETCRKLISDHILAESIERTLVANRWIESG